jgi:hypothetical protein
MKRILLIEDEEYKNHRAIFQLKKEYLVDVALSIDAALNFLSFYKYDLYILDIIMARGPYSIEETKNNLETGYVFYHKVLINKQEPVIIWTRNDELFTRTWGENVKNKLLKNEEEDQLLNAANHLFNCK